MAKLDIYQEITDRFVAALEAGTAPWQKPWTSSGPQNLQSKRPYRGVNALLCGLTAFEQGYADPRWTTFKGAKSLGGKVRKGEKSTLITFWKQLTVNDPDEPSGKRTIPMLRYYRVFNAAQVDWPEGVLKPLPSNDSDPIAATEQLWEDWDDKPELIHGGNRACYVPLDDAIHLPGVTQFRSRTEYEATRWHEAVHATGHVSRLNRPELASSKFGSEPYSREELVAEIGSAMLLAHAGIEHDFVNAAAYVGHWASKLRNEPKLIVQAAGRAQKACDHIQGISLG